MSALSASGVARLALVAMGMLALASAASGASEGERPGASPASAQPARLTVLYDAFGRDDRLQKDWGYAALVEIAGLRILFDTGNDPQVFEHNVRSLGVDLKTLDFVVLSHRHGDHTTGLAYLLAENPKVQIYAPQEGFGVFGASLPSSFYRKNPALPKELRYFDGNPPERMQFGKAWPDANITLIEETTRIAPGVHLIALVSDVPGTREMRELSLAIETAHGMVLVVGCSHPGIERIVAAAAEIDRRIHLIAGGLHLVTTPDAEIARLMAVLSETYRVAWIAPGHCTGEPAFEALITRFGDRNVYAGLGTTLALGADPRAGLPGESRFALGPEDLADYRQVLRGTLVRFGRPSAIGRQ